MHNGCHTHPQALTGSRGNRQRCSVRTTFVCIAWHQLHVHERGWPRFVKLGVRLHGVVPVQDFAFGLGRFGGRRLHVGTSLGPPNTTCTAQGQNQQASSDEGQILLLGWGAHCKPPVSGASLVKCRRALIAWRSPCRARNRSWVSRDSRRAARCSTRLPLPAW